MTRTKASQVPQEYVDPILREVLVRAEARKRASSTHFDPSLGSNPEEAAARIKEIQGDINLYGEYVYGLKPEGFHKYWNKAVDDVIYRRVPQNKILIIAPPSTAKSTWNSIIRATYHLGKHPDDHVVNITSSDSNAREFDGAWARTIEESVEFRRIFDDPKAKPYKKIGWSSEGRYLRGVPMGDRHPTYLSVSLNTSIMGKRSNIILDDPMDQKSAQSEAEQRKAKAYLDQTLIPRLQPKTGWMLAVMTRFHEFDLASHMIRLAQESEDWIYICTPMVATQVDSIMRRPGDLLWPDRFDDEFVALERRRMTTAEFNMIHQGDPTGMGGDVFKDAKWFKPLPENFWVEIFPKCKIIMAGDLAFSEKKSKKTCFTVLITIAIDRDFNMYVLHVYRARMSQKMTENALVAFIKAAKPIVMGIEEDNFHKKLTRTIARNVLKKAMCNIRLISPDKDKRARAMLPAGRAENGRLFVDTRQHWYQTFMLECLGFPNTRFKDQVDTLSLAAHMVQSLEELTEDERTEEVEHVA